MERNLPQPRPTAEGDLSLAPFASIQTFGRVPRLDQVTQPSIVIVGAPFDAGVSYRPGARFGPAHIRQASRFLGNDPYNPALGLSPFSSVQVADAGDMTITPYDIAKAIVQVQEQARHLRRDGARLITLGGDHTIALPLLREVVSEHGPVAVLHFDAHLDTWDENFGETHWHGSPFRRAFEEGLIDKTASMHVGIRGSLMTDNDLRDDAGCGFQVLTARQFARESLQDLIERMLTRLGDRPIYVSIDIDVIDPAHAPGTGTPEVGGLTSRELLEMLRALDGRTIVGVDIVEVSPAYDHADLTGIAASQIVFEMISVMAKFR